MKLLGVALGAGLALFVASGRVQAAESHYSKAYDRCMDVAGGVTSSMRDCTGEETKRWDASLNATYRQKMADLSPAAQAELREDERGWIKRRDLKCKHAGDDEAGGTLQLVEIDDCYLEETNKRAQYLQER